MRNKIIYFVFTTGSSKTPHKCAGAWEAMQQQSSRGSCQLSHSSKLLPSRCKGHQPWEIQSPGMRVKRCPGRKHAAWYLGCEDMILNPFRGFLFLFHHQCPKRCLRLSTNPSTLPPSSQKENYYSFSPSSSSHLIFTRCRTHSFPKTQRLVLTAISSHPACFHPSIPPEQHQNHERGEYLGLAFLHPAQLWWQARLDRGYWATAFPGAEGAPCPCLLSGATHCPPHQWLPERKGLLPSRRSCIWNAQYIQLKQTTITN